MSLDTMPHNPYQTRPETHQSLDRALDLAIEWDTIRNDFVDLEKVCNRMFTSQDSDKNNQITVKTKGHEQTSADAKFAEPVGMDHNTPVVRPVADDV